MLSTTSGPYWPTLEFAAEMLNGARKTYPSAVPDAGVPITTDGGVRSGRETYRVAVADDDCPAAASRRGAKVPAAAAATAPTNPRRVQRSSVPVSSIGRF